MKPVDLQREVSDLEVALERARTDADHAAIAAGVARLRRLFQTKPSMFGEREVQALKAIAAPGSKPMCRTLPARSRR